MKAKTSLDAILATLRKHGVASFRGHGVAVVFGPQAFVEDLKPEGAAVEPAQESEGVFNDPDLFLSAEQD